MNYLLWLWLTLFNPTPHYVHYPPQPAYQLEHQRQQMNPLAPVIGVPVQTVAPVPFVPGNWPPGYIPNPTQLGLTYIPNPTELGLR